MARFKSPFDKRPVRDENWPCDTPRRGDGADPRHDRPHRKVDNRKTLQLCAQVADALSLALMSCRDDALRELQVRYVVPAPDSTQLLVALAAPPGLSAEAAEESLRRAAGSLRAAVAAAIHRKRTPQLKYVVLPLISEH